MFESLGRLRVPGGGRPRPPRSPHQSQCIEDDPSPVKDMKTTLPTRASLPQSPVFHTQTTLSNRSLSSQDLLQASGSRPRRRKRLFADKPSWAGGGGEDSSSKGSLTSQKDLFGALEEENGLEEDMVLGSPSILTRSSQRRGMAMPCKVSSEEEQDLFRGSSQESEIMVSPSPNKLPPPRKRKRFQKKSSWKPLSSISELAPSQFIRDDDKDGMSSDNSLVPSQDHPSVKGSFDIVESLEKEPSIESVQSEEATATALGEQTCLSSTKKRRKNSKFGLCAKLERLQRERESDLALRRHVLPKLQRTHGSGESEEKMVESNELTLEVTSVQEEQFWRRVQGCRIEEDGDSEPNEVVVLLQRGVLGAALVDSIVEGVDIQVKGQQLEQSGGVLFGVQMLKVLDRPLRTRLNLMSGRRTRTIVKWDCQC